MFFILVWNQNKSTRQTVEATLKAIHVESKEIDRRANKECIFRLIQIISNINRLSDIDDVQIELHKALDESTKLTIINNEGKNTVEYRKLELIHNILLFYQLLIKYKDEAFSESDLYMIHIQKQQRRISTQFDELIVIEDDNDLNISEFLKRDLFNQSYPNENSSISFVRYRAGYKLHENSLNSMKHIVFLLTNHLVKFKSHIDSANFN